MRPRVRVLVGVNGAVGVGVPVSVGLGSRGVAHAPNQVDESERKQQPTRDRAAGGFDDLEVLQGGADAESDEPEQDRTRDMAHAAQRGDAQRLSARPPPRARHRDERQIVVGADQRVDESDAGCGDAEGESGAIQTCVPGSG